MSKSQTRQRSAKRGGKFILKAELVEQVDVYSDDSGIYPLTHYKTEDYSQPQLKTEENHYVSGVSDLFQEGRLRSRQIDDLNDKGFELCGYLREPFLENKKLKGICALCEGKTPCIYQKFIHLSGKNNCLLLKTSIEDMIADYQRRQAKRL